MTDSGLLFVSSGDLIADRRYQWAIDHAARGDLIGAADILAQTVERAPSFATAWFVLGTIRDRLADRDGAMAAFAKAKDADPEDLHGAALQLARLDAGGETLPAMSQTYVRRLFDQYAGRYDQALLARLGYRGPALLLEAAESVCRARGRPLHFSAMLDLGCGTGLTGAAFRPVVERLVGVDLSPRMIAAAASKHVYDELVTADIVDHLDRASTRDEIYQLIVAADVFVYANDLEPILAAVARVIAADGMLAFTVETHTGDGVRLLPTLRYAHGEPYLHQALRDAGFSVARLVRASIRREKGAPIDSLVVIARPFRCGPHAGDNPPVGR